MTFVYFLAAATGVEALLGVLRISFPLAVVASELILGATAYERRGRGGVRSRREAFGLAAYKLASVLRSLGSAIFSIPSFVSARALSHAAITLSTKRPIAARRRR